METSSKRTEYRPTVSTDDLIRVYDQIRGCHPDNALIDTVLAKLQGNDADDRIAAEPVLALHTSSTEDLLAILEGDGDGDGDGDSKSESKLIAFKTDANKKRVALSHSDAAKALAIKQLRELPSAKRRSAKNSIVIPDVTIPKTEKRPVDGSIASRTENGLSVDLKSEQKRSAGDISFIEDDWNDEEIVDKLDRDAGAFSESNSKFTESTDGKPLESVVSTSRSKEDRANGSLSVSIAGNGLAIVKQINGDDRHQHANSSKKIKKKMTEVDKLLMDEGAVNMLYQLERSNNNTNIPAMTLKPNSKSMISISKEKRYLLNKTKILKSTVFNSTNSEFRKDIKIIRTRGESAKKEFKKPVALELHEGVKSSLHNNLELDESRIIRRHSSSSFSSGCLSPRPQTPTEFILHVNKNSSSGEKEINNLTKNNKLTGISVSLSQDAFDKPKLNINKSLKRKINESANVKKKQNSTDIQLIRDIIGNAEKFDLKKYKQFYAFTYNIVDNIAYIVFNSSKNSLFDIELLEELNAALILSSECNVKLITLTSEDGSLCKGLNLKNIVHSEQQRSNASKLLETLRDLIIRLLQFKGPIVVGVDGTCCSFGLVLLSIADFVLVSDRSAFCISPQSRRTLPFEGMSIFNILCPLPIKLKNEFLVYGFLLPASEAKTYNLVTRICDFQLFLKSFQAYVVEISKYPQEVFQIHKNIILKDQIDKIIDTFDEECIILIDYWCSNIGQSAIREVYS